jgi:type I restriction enzyme S subunit
MSELPIGWEWTQLEELAAPIDRAITDGPFGSNLKSEHYTETGARVIRLQNIGDGFFRDERSYISLRHFDNLRSHEVRTGDLVVASLGDNPPRACLIPELNASAIVKADCIRIRLADNIDPRWVLYSLVGPEGKRHAANLIRGIGRPRLGMSQVRQIPIPVPPLAEQRRIVAALEDHLSRLDAGNLAICDATRRASLIRIKEPYQKLGPPCA